ncbi:DNA helicase II [Candidatus Glomeribacter gigasporarum BEG34]|uniref:DNA 3'-5' helicase n=1 Tax=Candidatus Glomeribacter gigasporarum BEG34 TaxID=1070319 RepID=G2J9G8_9BURK|nr:DNA helicase II [Candidatus Glomeribacter gigasporarum BEG34]
MIVSDLLAHLNPEQRAAVTLPDESALILAGAGSGKTRVLTTRIAWLLQSQRIRPAEILAVTFTNKAAREMMTRLTALLPIHLRGMWIGTFHGLCNRMLRAHHQTAELPQTFQILDSADQLSALKRLLKRLNIDDEKYPPKQVQRFINQAKEQGLRPAGMDASDPFSQKCAELYAAYHAQCQREGVVDFAELLLRSYELLARNAEMAAHYQARFKHMLVDEFQDTNTLQYAWLKQLAGPCGAVFAVGDDDQSIYAFRGANVGNMRDFEREYKVRHLIRLEQNYRSHGHILDAANVLIAHNTRRLGKNLRTDAGCGECVRVVSAETDSQEALWLVSEVRALNRKGIPLDQIAVLYRSNAQSRVLEHTLMSAGIPYRVTGGLRFFERAEIKHALAYLRLLENPDDDTAFMRVVNFPARSIGARTLEVLSEAARPLNRSLHAAAAQLGGKTAAHLQRFIQLIEEMRARTRGLSLSETVQHVIDASGLVEHYRAEREGQDRIENLRELVNAALAFTKEEHAEPEAPPDDEITPLSAFLAHASLEAGEHQAQAGQAAVQLMTVHAAKGLEFSAVFITGLEEGLFPHQNSIIDASGLEEERRLMYVAMTRARARLYLSFARSRMLHGQSRHSLRSRFLDELPEQTLQHQALHGASARSGAPRPHASHTAGASWTQQAPAAPRRALSEFSAPPHKTVSGFYIGQSVSHAVFGHGTITAFEGNGADARAQVKFTRSGAKWLVLGMAKLQPVL